MRRTIIIATVLTVIIGVGVAIAIGIQPDTYSIAEDETIEKLTIGTDTIIATVNAAGRLEAIGSVDLAFDTGGKIVTVYVSEGDQIEADLLLMTLDDTDLTYAVELAKTELKRAEMQLEKLLLPPTDSEIRAAQASLDSAQANLAELMDGPSEADVEAAQIALDSAQANLNQIIRDPDTDTLTVQAANLRKTEIALAQAQFAYDAVAYDSRAASAQGAQLEQATIDYEAALANYNLAVKDADRADVLSAQSQVVQAENNLDTLLQDPNVSEILSAQSQVIQAEANLETLTQGVADVDIALAEATIQTAMINLEQAELALRQTQLYSPIGGTVTRLNVKEDTVLTPGETALSLADLTAFKLAVEIDEIDINRIELGQPVTINLDSLPDEEYQGEVTEIGVAPVENSTGGIVAYPVTILIDSVKTPFKLGMNVNATIETERLEDVLVVENRAIEIDRSDGQAYVEKLVSDGRSERTAITLGRRSSLVSQVLDGVEEGDTILIRERSRREELQRAIQGEN